MILSICPSTIKDTAFATARKVLPQRLFALLLCAALLISAVPPALAEDQPIEAERFVAPTLPPDAIAWDKNHPDILDEDMLYAHSAILIEAGTGEVLFEKNADEIMFPASTTKIMTAYIALQMSDLENDVVTVSQNAIGIPDIFRIPEFLLEINITRFTIRVHG